MTTFGIIGTGQMGGAIAKALRENVEGDRIMLANRSPKKAQVLAQVLDATAVDNQTAAGCSYVILGVKPQNMAELLDDLRPTLEAREDRFVLVSLAAGLDIAAIQRLAGHPWPVLRVMPNTPVSIGAGMCLYSVSPETTKEEVKQFLDAAAAAGRFDAISEAQMNVGSVLTGCGPAYVSIFLEAMADGAVACGLPRGKALEYAAQAIAGTAQLYLDSRIHPGEMKDAVCSPGGSTIAGVRALEQHAFRAAVMEAVEASSARGLELGKTKK